MNAPPDTAPPFLLGLELAVARDPAPSGFVGTVAIGLERRGQPTVWWLVEGGAPAETRWTTVRPEVVDCAVLLEGEPPRVVEAQGDADLFDRFVARYGPKKSALELRAGRPG